MMDYKAPPFPERLEIELASNCNLSCSYCPRRYIKGLKGYIDLDLFKKIIDEASHYPETIVVLHRRGESMLHPRFTEALEHIAGKFKEVQMATNATLLTEDKFGAIVGAIDFLSFSLDAPAVYDRTRAPAKYSVVEKNILRFLNFNRGKIKTQVSMVRTSETSETDIRAFKDIWRGKVDRIRIYEEHSIDGVFGSLKSPRKDRRPCVMPIYEMLVYDDGKVGRCNHDWNGDPMGNLNCHTITQVWHSPKYESLRKEHTDLVFTDAVCRGCDSWYPEIGNQGTGEVLEDD